MRDRFNASPTKREQREAGAIAVVSTPSDATRTTLAITLEVSPTSNAEQLQTVTISENGAATTTFSSRAITTGKRLRFQLFALQVECLGSDIGPQRAYLRLRSEPAAPTTAASPLQLIVPAGCNGGIVNASAREQVEIADGFDLTGDGDTTFGFTLECPDYVAGTGTLRVKATILAFEY